MDVHVRVRVVAETEPGTDTETETETEAGTGTEPETDAESGTPGCCPMVTSVSARDGWSGPHPECEIRRPAHSLQRANSVVG